MMTDEARPPVFVVARREDRLGGRLGAMVNAWTVARLLGAEFRFAWPRGRFLELDDPTEVFATAFVHSYEMDEESFARATLVVCTSAATLADLQHAVQTAASPAVILVTECFAQIRFPGQSAAEAAALFRASFEALSWSPTIEAVRERISALPDDVRYAMHVRAGDFVRGIRYGTQAGEDWTNFFPAEKYIPTDVLKAYAREAATRGERLLVFSDNEEAVALVRDAHPGFLTPSDLISGLEGLTEAQRALAEILLMTRMERLFAPDTSAFSRLAANVGGATMLGIRDVMDVDRGTAITRRFMAEHAAMPRSPDRLLSRDACWYLDLLGDRLGLGEQARLATLCVAADPDFCRGRNWLAATRALARDREGFEGASAAAFALATVARRVHDDPLVESLAVAAAGRLFLSVAEGSGDGWPGRAIRTVRHFAQALLRNGEADHAIAFLPGLAPHQLHLHEIVLNLRHQRALVRHARQRGLDLAQAIETVFGSAGAVAELPQWRSPGPQSLLPTDSYPSVLRVIETFTIVLFTALRLTMRGAALQPVPQGTIDQIVRSRSGLHWACGWASPGGTGGHRRLIGIAEGDGQVFWGHCHLRRVDVARYLKNPWAIRSGFMIPFIPATGASPSASDMRLLRRA